MLALVLGFYFDKKDYKYYTIPVVMKIILNITISLLILNSCNHGYDNNQALKNYEIIQELKPQKSLEESKFIDSMNNLNSMKSYFWIDEPDINSGVERVYVMGMDLLNVKLKNDNQKDSLNKLALEISNKIFTNVMSKEMKEHITKIRFVYSGLKIEKHVKFFPIIEFKKDSIISLNN